MYLDQLYRLTDRAVVGGAFQHSVMTREWDVSADCQKPVTREVYARPSRRHGEKWIVVHNRSINPLRVIIHARCRRCAACLRHRSRLWSARAVSETKAAVRTWFGTITLRPERQQWALDSARHKLSRQGIDFDALSEEERFRLRHSFVSQELTRWLKRVRKVSGAPLRFCLVAEAHKSGAPHYHILVHECDPALPVRKEVLKSAWTWGFTRWKLVNDPRAALYVTKYLSKDAKARVRASLHYGVGGEERAGTILKIRSESQSPTGCVTTSKKNSSF